jgi:hypothetical protein
MPSKSANVTNEKQDEALKDKGMTKERAAKIANATDSSQHGREQSGKGSNSRRGGTTAQKKDAGRKSGEAAARRTADRPSQPTPTTRSWIWTAEPRQSTAARTMVGRWTASLSDPSGSRWSVTTRSSLPASSPYWLRTVTASR